MGEWAKYYRGGASILTRVGQASLPVSPHGLPGQQGVRCEPCAALTGAICVAAHAANVHYACLAQNGGLDQVISGFGHSVLPGVIP